MTPWRGALGALARYEIGLFLAATISLGVLAVWLGSLVSQHLASAREFSAVLAIKQAHRSAAHRP